MSVRRFITSQPGHWDRPRQSNDAAMRRYVHGPIRPMQTPGLFERLFGR